MAVIAAAIALFPLLDGRPPRWWSIAVASIVLAIAFFRPMALAPANRAWLVFGGRLHKVTSFIVLGLLFFLVLTPLAIVSRLFRSNMLRLKRVRQGESYWMERDADLRPGDFSKPF